jgi:peptidoglycan/xylan/chitin deacetylase (PgdA/CDA1 family)
VLLPKAWEKDAKDAIEVNFDLDNGTPIFALGKSAPARSTDSQYGPAKGVLLIAKTLDDCNVPAAFYMLAASAMLTPPMTPLITNSGKSEVALHGYIHEPVEVLDKGPEEKRRLSQPIDCSAKQTGKRPVGSRRAGWAVSNRTIGIDLLYGSSMANPTRPRMVHCMPAPLSSPGVGGTRC